MELRLLDTAKSTTIVIWFGSMVFKIVNLFSSKCYLSIWIGRPWSSIEIKLWYVDSLRSIVFISEGTELIESNILWTYGKLATETGSIEKLASFIWTLILACLLSTKLVSQLHHPLFFSDLGLELPEFSVLLKLLLLFLDDVILQWRQVWANFKLNLLLSHIFELFVLIV